MHVDIPTQRDFAALQPLLSPKQQAALSFIAGYAKAHGYGPSVREIANSIGSNSSHIGERIIGDLVDRGLVRRIPSRARAVQAVGNVPIPQAPDGAPLHFIPAELIYQRAGQGGCQ